jgi:hypothetical protein
MMLKSDKGAANTLSNENLTVTETKLTGETRILDQTSFQTPLFHLSWFLLYITGHDFFLMIQQPKPNKAEIYSSLYIICVFIVTSTQYHSLSPTK